MSREPLTLTLVEALFHLATGTAKTAEQYEREYHTDPLRLEAAANPQVIDFLAAIETRTLAQQARLEALRKLKVEIDDEQQKLDDAERIIFEAAIKGEITIMGRRGSSARPEQWGESEAVPVAYFYNPITIHLPSNTLQPDFYSTTSRAYPKLKSLPTWNDCRLRLEELQRVASPAARASGAGKKIGRPLGDGIDDGEILEEMHRKIVDGEFKSATAAAAALAFRAKGSKHGTSSALRLKRKYEKRFEKKT